MFKLKIKKLQKIGNIYGLLKLRYLRRRKWRNKWDRRKKRWVANFKSRLFFKTYKSRNWLRKHKRKNYSFNLKTKNALNLFYGSLRKKQLKIILKKSSKLKTNIQFHEKFQTLLENRLGTVVYRMGFVKSIQTGRLWIKHGFFYLNGVKVHNSNTQVFPGDFIYVDINSKWRMVYRLNKIPYKSKFLSKSPFEINFQIGFGVILSKLIPFKVLRRTARVLKVKSAIKHLKGF